jgi:hypothetical protein
MSLPVQIPETLEINGVVYKLPQWLEIGQSVFLPCVDVQGIARHVRRHYAPHGWRLETSQRVERSLLGVRVWRLG